MQSSGWKPGTALGASSIPIPAHEASSAKVRIAVKDDMLGLGASLKSKSVEHQRTGLDAFQGLLGRLNAKDEKELKVAEEKVESKKLATYAQGRWGGMIWIPGGLLVQDDPKNTENLSPITRVDTNSDEVSEENDERIERPSESPTRSEKRETSEERAARKSEKQRRKEDRRSRKEAKRLQRLHEESQTASSGTSTPTVQEANTEASSSMLTSNVTTKIVSQRLQNGRHILRGRNIQAKRMAFTDAKGLDQIFMRQQKEIL